MTPQDVQFPVNPKYPQNKENQTPSYGVTYDHPTRKYSKGRPRRTGRSFGASRIKAAAFYVQQEAAGTHPIGSLMYYAFGMSF